MNASRPHARALAPLLLLPVAPLVELVRPRERLGLLPLLRLERGREAERAARGGRGRAALLLHVSAMHWPLMQRVLGLAPLDDVERAVLPLMAVSLLLVMAWNCEGNPRASNCVLSQL